MVTQIRNIRSTVVNYGFTIPYHWLVDNTTDRYWTYIMRDNPWYLYIPGWIGMIGTNYVLIGIYNVPWFISVPISSFTFIYGLMTGHVRWGKQNPEVEEDHSAH